MHDDLRASLFQPRENGVNTRLNQLLEALVKTSLVALEGDGVDYNQEALG